MTYSVTGNASGNVSLKGCIRRFVPSRARRFASSLLARALRTHWKSLTFGHIDRTPLAALSQNRLFEPELKLLPLLVSGAGFAFDVGANRGEYTYVFEKTVGAARTYAIEPLPQLCSQLRRLFPDANILNLGLSDAVAKLTLKTPIIQGAPLWTRSTLEHFTEDEETGAVFEEVPVLPLDLLCEQLHVDDVEVIKIDVEGHEKSVLLGATRILKACRPILLVEIEQRHHTEPITNIFSFIEELDYEGFFFDASTISLRSIAKFSAETHQQRHNLGSTGYVNNFLFFDEATALSVTEFVNRLAK
jgi:FkbM family methyltransferase